eukprot:scaffold8414_cov35-Attheya_sp.AAC.2
MNTIKDILTNFRYSITLNVSKMLASYVILSIDVPWLAAQFHFLFGVATDWKIDKQLATAAHSTDAELRSMFTAVKSTLAIRAFMMHLGYGPPKPTRHHEDNQPSIAT